MLTVLPLHLQEYYGSLSSPLFPTIPSNNNKLRPPRVYGSHSEYVALIKRMQAVSMVAFTAHPKAVNGCFGVPKSDGDIRLVIDAQPANPLFAVPPHIQLPTPANIAAVSTSHLHNTGRPFYVSKCDLSNFYHHIALPPFMQPYFALPPIHVSELGLNADECGADPAGFIYPMCTTMPMGWSHSLFIFTTTIHQR